MKSKQSTLIENHTRIFNNPKSLTLSPGGFRVVGTEYGVGPSKPIDEFFTQKCSNDFLRSGLTELDPRSKTVRLKVYRIYQNKAKGITHEELEKEVDFTINH